ncbi:pectinesterase [Chitinophaga jiangningensis]|uniref:Pectinesterase n=1 Tax=Chitinophaga jiangningensis TaxID=1419482 RepID=A0A1M7K889_9BACT|nr:pectinesterase family protein [Chitinophaga jiangningensis]SHM61057.1 pectinesterase [Chitinophaga jiangningensis]
MRNFLFAFLCAAAFLACGKSSTPPVTTASVKPQTELLVPINITVAQDGSGNYTTIQQAFNAVPDNSSNRTVIYIKNGTYKEVLTLASSKKNVTIVGESVNGVKLTYDNYASKINPATGAAYGTSGSSSTFIRAEGFYAVNITFENSSGPVGQALAIYIAGDKAVFNNCRFLGRQDTYYGGNCRQYLKNCYLEGTTDFIFGPSTAVFESCKLYSYGGSAITAASTESYVPYGFVFLKCNISGAAGAKTDLGRPWRPYAAVAYLNTAMTSVINTAGWNNWGNAANESTARYGEYRNNGDGSNIDGRPAWIHRITTAEAAGYTVLNVLKTTYTNPVTTDNWNPGTVISATGATVN